MRFECPACHTGMESERTFDEEMSITCSRCGLECIIPPDANPDEAFLEFLVRHDEKSEKKAAVNPDKAAENQDDMDRKDVVLPPRHAAEKSNSAQAEIAHPKKRPGPASRHPRLQQGHASGTHPQPPGSAHAHPNNGTRAEDDTVRPEHEIARMIGAETPDPLVRKILYSKRSYVADYRIIREPEPEYGRSPGDITGVDGRLASVLAGMGISRLYRFQEDAIKCILAGDNAIIEAPTASGKTEAFLIPVIQRILVMQEQGNERGLRAILVYPTKALARDQMPKIRRLAGAVGLAVDNVDGDTDSEQRSKTVANPPHILVTNFDLLHHQMWRRTAFSRILHTAKIIVADEIHTYTGIFGSNVHHIIRRLARVAGASSNNSESCSMQIIGASATIDGAARFCADLFGVDRVAHVQGTGPSRQIEFAMLFPSRQSPRSLMADLTQGFASAGRRTMAFSNSHRGAELLAMQCRWRGVKIRVHRAGLMPEQRVEAEAAFKSKKLQAISCTPTLELGIDIGHTDCVVSAPTPINRLIQRIGRAARREGSRGYAFLALGDDPISQYYRNHPCDYFEDKESMYIDPRNPYVEECQIIATAHDRPIARGELPEHAHTIERLVARGDLKRAGDTIHPSRGERDRTGRMLAAYNIRGAGESVDIICNGAKMGDRACPIALEELHQGAVYLLAGKPYVVREFEYPQRQYAVIDHMDFRQAYYTRALTTEQPSIEEIIESRTVRGVETAFCRLRIQKIVTGYAKIELQDMQGYGKTNTYDIISSGGAAITMLDCPLSYTYVTKGIAFCAPRPRDEVRKASELKRTQRLREQGDGPHAITTTTTTTTTTTKAMPSADRLEEPYITASGYHAAEHVVIEGSNMITGGASRDLGGISMGESGMIFVHDGVIGGSGASRALYERLESAFERGVKIIGECPCASESGCPRCTMSYRCGNNNQYLHKAAALEIFERINGGECTALIDSFDQYNPIV